MIYGLLLIVADFLALLAAFTAAYIVRVQVDTRPLVREIGAIEFIKVFLLIIPFWLLIMAFLGLYSKDIFEKRLSELSRLFVASFIGILLVIGLDFVSDETIFPARLVPVYAFVGSFLFLVIERNLMWLWRRSLFRYGKGVRYIMLIGSTDATKVLGGLLSETATSGYDIKAIIGNKQSLPANFKGKHFSSLEDGLSAIETLGIDTVIQTQLYETSTRNEHILDAVRQQHLAYKFIPAQAEFYAGKNTLELFHGYPVIAVHQTPLIGWGRIVKRLFDLTVAMITFIITLPLFLILALLIKISDPKGPVLYKHKRITRFGTPFFVYKFRSMYWKYSTGQAASKKTDEDILREMGREDLIREFKQNQKLAKDPRVTPVGRFLRKTSLDELPQLINVIKGELSIVGPRPVVESELKHYREQGGGSLVLSVKSGITGLWQVSGRSDLSYEERVKLDLYYVQHWSFWLDIKIMLKTIPVVLMKKGAR